MIKLDSYGTETRVKESQAGNAKETLAKPCKGSLHRTRAHSGLYPVMHGAPGLEMLLLNLSLSRYHEQLCLI